MQAQGLTSKAHSCIVLWCLLFHGEAKRNRWPWALRMMPAVSLHQGHDQMSTDRMLRLVLSPLVHGSPQVEQQLARLEECHENFRLWITAEPHEAFPIGLLQAGIKYTNEAPVGMKAGLRTSLQWVTQARPFFHLTRFVQRQQRRDGSCAGARRPTKTLCRLVTCSLCSSVRCRMPAFDHRSLLSAAVL